MLKEFRHSAYALEQAQPNRLRGQGEMLPFAGSNDPSIITRS